MPDIDPPDLFAAAGIELEEDAPKSGGISRPKRPRKPRPPTPAAWKAAAARGGRAVSTSECEWAKRAT